MTKAVLLDHAGLFGFGWVWIEDAEGKVEQWSEFYNKITEKGDKIYAQRGAGIGALDAPAGMHLGTGTTDPSKSGGGAVMGSYISGSNRSFDATYPQWALVSGASWITYRCTWAEGIATNGAISEAVLHNQSAATDAAADADHTVSRIEFSPAKNKTSTSSMYLVWNHIWNGA